MTRTSPRTRGGGPRRWIMDKGGRMVSREEMNKSSDVESDSEDMSSSSSDEEEEGGRPKRRRPSARSSTTFV
jgi:hypothetical protein